ncbi:hypothetical protein RAS1_21360 [Phycisphaerae bacterium RAS1]|nr:hypothetical protein RAS1_21360 [Phycisphaerae bacterium RAS1]
MAADREKSSTAVKRVLVKFAGSIGVPPVRVQNCTGGTPMPPAPGVKLDQYRQTGACDPRPRFRTLVEFGLP